MTKLDPRFNVENIKRLTGIHIRRYSRRIEIGQDPSALDHDMVNVKQCEMYLALWKSVEEKEYEWSKLNADEKNEVTDAVLDEE